MAKAWCCGGGGGSSGGGLTLVNVDDTPTVTLSGDGTAANPITADAVVAPEPNGLEAVAAGLLVAPSADAGNALTIGADGRLYTPTSGGGGLTSVATGNTPTVTLSGNGTAGSPVTATAVVAPEPNGLEAGATGLLVAPSADTGNQLVMGSDGRLMVQPEPALVWGQEPPVRVLWQTGQPNPPTGSPEPQGTFTAPEDGIYDVDYVVTGSVSANNPAASFNANITVRTSITDPLNFYVAQTQYADGTEASISGAGSVTVSRRVQLTAGQVVTGLVQRVETGTATSTGFDVLAYWAWHKISD